MGACTLFCRQETQGLSPSSGSPQDDRAFSYAGRRIEEGFLTSRTLFGMTGFCFVMGRTARLGRRALQQQEPKMLA